MRTPSQSPHPGTYRVGAAGERFQRHGWHGRGAGQPCSEGQTRQRMYTKEYKRRQMNTKEYKGISKIPSACSTEYGQTRLVLFHSRADKEDMPRKGHDGKFAHRRKVLVSLDIKRPSILFQSRIVPSAVRGHVYTRRAHACSLATDAH